MIKYIIAIAVLWFLYRISTKKDEKIVIKKDTKIDFKKIKNLVKNKMVLDLRNIFNKKDLIKMGFTYSNIGQK